MLTIGREVFALEGDRVTRWSAFYEHGNPCSRQAPYTGISAAVVHPVTLANWICTTTVALASTRYARKTSRARNDDLVPYSSYNALNQRIGIDDSGTQTWTVYDGSSADAKPYADFNGSGTLTERYLHGPGVVNGAVVDELLARTSSGGTTAWYLTDKLGSVRDIVSSSGGA